MKLWKIEAAHRRMAYASNYKDQLAGRADYEKEIHVYAQYIADVQSGAAKYPRRLLPDGDLSKHDLMALLSMMASARRYAPDLAREDYNWLCNVPYGHAWNPSSVVIPCGEDYVTPAALRVGEDQIRLMEAFRDQMIAKAAEIPDPPLTGRYRMTKTGAPLVDDLLLDELRLVITPKGFWTSMIKENDHCLWWWSPGWDNAVFHNGLKYGLVAQVLCACLWHDLKATKGHSFIYTRERYGRRQKRKAKRERVIYLPRTVVRLDWSDEFDVRRMPYAHKSDYSVRAHYRNLPNGMTASDAAKQNADDAGFPEPPDGYTFVRPYAVGEGASTAPRIVSKGLQVAKVALSLP